MLKHLASGGMAEVMLGRSDGIEGFARHVVLKRIRPDLARDQRFIRMFVDEARLAATLHHQHIVQVHDVGEVGGEYFIAMEYVHGEDVRKILSCAARQRGHVPLGHALAIVSAAASGLHYAHERCGNDGQPLEIVHRDVSPSNILVGYDGAIKVVDFGIATASLRQETRSGSLKGKLAYMSPEQCRGEPVDRRTDVYALGVVLYELATTTRMIKGDNDYLIMEQIVHGRIAPPTTRRPDLPSELCDIILRALATDREARYATADELRFAVEQFAAQSGLHATASAIATYMRQQFGQRPEPWLEIASAPDALDRGARRRDDSLPGSAWTDPPRGSMRTSSAIPLHPGQLPGDAARDATRAEPSARPVPAAPSATQSRMGWESQPVAVPRRFPAGRVAAISGAIIAGVATWIAMSDVARPGLPAAAPAAQPAATVAPTPIAARPSAPSPHPDLPALPEVIASGSAAPPPLAAAREGQPVVLHKGRPAFGPGGRASGRTADLAGGKPARGAAAEPRDGETERRAPPPPHSIAPTVVASGPALSQLVATAATPQIVTPAALEANRLTGDRRIVPDEATLAGLTRSNDTLIASYKVCVGSDGEITSVTQLRGTGFAAYDAKIQNTIRRDWRYRPFLSAGRPTAVCTVFRFVYSAR